MEKGVLAALKVPKDVLDKPIVDKGGLGIKECIVTMVENVEITVKIICMDIKRRSDAAWKKESGEKTIAELDAFKPDVVILADDNAQVFVGKAIANKYPIVYNGVNNDFSGYYAAGDAVTGLNERMNFMETAEMLKEIYKDLDRIVLITDMTETSNSFVKQFKEAKLPFAKIEAYQCDKLADIPESVPLKGEVIVNQARAKLLGVEIPIGILNAAEVYNEIDTLK